MGFRNGAYAKIWSTEPKSDTMTNVRLSISRKNKVTGEYDTEFSGFVGFVGTACAKKAACLKTGDRIKLGDVDVTTSFNKEKNKEYINYKCFNFEEGDSTPAAAPVSTAAPAYHGAQVDMGEVQEENVLPF